MIDLDQLDSVLTTRKPSNDEIILYMFWEKGISLDEFCELPLPYIFTILKVNNYVKKEEEKAYKRASRKK